MIFHLQKQESIDGSFQKSHDLFKFWIWTMTWYIKNNILVKFLVCIHDMLHEYRYTGHKFLFNIFNFAYLLAIQLFYSGYIPVTSKLGNNVLFPHGFNGIFISGSAEIGDNTIIYHQVTIGSTFLDQEDGGAPIIGANCLLGPDCKIIGNIRIGNNVKVASNVSLNKDVPNNCTIVPSKPRCIKHKKGVPK